MTITFQANVAGVPCNVNFDDLPEESRSFVIEYGLRQYIQDGAAVSKTFTDKERKGQVKTDDEIAAEKQDGVLERLENLKSGEFTRRGVGEAKMTPEERERSNVIMAALTAAAKAANVKLPKKTGKDADPDKLAQIVANYYAKYQGDVDKEVARRLKAQKPLDLSEIGLG